MIAGVMRYASTEPQRFDEVFVEMLQATLTMAQYLMDRFNMRERDVEKQNAGTVRPTPATHAISAQ